MNMVDHFIATQHSTLDKQTFKAHLHTHFLHRVWCKFPIFILVPKTNVDPMKIQKSHKEIGIGNETSYDENKI
jgi:hypothetical protein